ncbi:hypothetical protein GCM10012280_69050 [Wenjunlia tyrosinilytica]|uniref:Uncharacterized protein n=1 Tax=Wenjunlia tyrosinilytica TaxID=1544741 RepID=A0A918E2E7_9ACTN|nr:hypothetical protein GCM10012280_69050 [Wenjunlia tyrosinilytica]
MTAQQPILRMKRGQRRTPTLATATGGSDHSAEPKPVRNGPGSRAAAKTGYVPWCAGRLCGFPGRGRGEHGRIPP